MRVRIELAPGTNPLQSRYRRRYNSESKVTSKCKVSTRGHSRGWFYPSTRQRCLLRSTCKSSTRQEAVSEPSRFWGVAVLPLLFRIFQAVPTFNQTRSNAFIYVTEKIRWLYFVALARPYRLAVRTPPFHGGGTGSIPVRVAIFTKSFGVLTALIRSAIARVGTHVRAVRRFRWGNLDRTKEVQAYPTVAVETSGT